MKLPCESFCSFDNELLRALLDNPYESLILIDKKGIICFSSRHNTLALGKDPSELVGKNIKEILKDNGMENVLKTGKAEIGRVFDIGGQKRIIARIPLRDTRGEVIGVVSKIMFHQPQKMSELSRRVELLEEHVRYYQQEIATIKGCAGDLSRIIGESEAMWDAKKLTLQAAATDAPVFITGESGTGKELLAEAIHYKSNRASGPFIKVNCAAIPSELIESELFGYEGGAFTGALAKGKMGKFELAHKGTIFLDEIGDMPLQMQAKLLRVIQDHEIDRIGGSHSRKVDFRIIAATNKDIETSIQKGTFRMDLYYRVNIFQIRAPALREIPEDIPRIAYYFMSLFHNNKDQSPELFSEDAMMLLKRYQWPGNVRELKNIIERAMSVAESRMITAEDLPNPIREIKKGDTTDHPEQVYSLREIMVRTEKRAIYEALCITRGNKATAAKLLGIHRTGLYQKLKLYHLEVSHEDGSIKASV